MSSLQDVLSRLTQGPLAEALRDRDRYEREIWANMATSDDPLVREIGVQLRDGTATPRQLLSNAAYAPVFERGLAKLREFDPEAVAAEATAAEAARLKRDWSAR